MRDRPKYVPRHAAQLTPRRTRVVALLVALLAVLSFGVAAAPGASALCTGSPGCASGWRGVTVYDASSGENFNVNIDVDWEAASNERTVYFSGSTCFPTQPYLCSGFESMTVFYRVHCSTCRWLQVTTHIPGPSYGSYSWTDFGGWTTARDIVVNGCSFGRCVNSPIILN